MSALTVDATSAKTLPLLDGLVQSDEAKFNAIIASTTGEPLERLLKASIARQTLVGHPFDPALTEPARALEHLIMENLLGGSTDSSRNIIHNALYKRGQKDQQMMLMLSILRYNMFLTTN